MKKIYGLYAALVAVAAMVSCSGNVDKEPLQDLYLEADKSAIGANGRDEVKFTAWYGNADVSDSDRLVISYLSADGIRTELQTEGNVFRTDRTGTYQFTASYRTEEGDELRSVNGRTVKAVEVDEYVRRVMAMQFTSTGCPSCSILGSYMAEIREAEPKVSVASFHTDYGSVSDPMTISTTRTLAEHYGYVSSFGLPFFAVDMNLKLTAAVEKAPMEKLIQERLARTASCGIAIESEYSGTTLSMDLKITSNTERAYRYVILLVEDGIEWTQAGVDSDYVHNNVVRAMVNMDIEGDHLNGRKALSPGVEVKESRSVSIREEWNIENIRIIAAVLTPEDANWFSCENVAECRAGDKSDYMKIQ